MKDVSIPTATYRIQFTPQFKFTDALDILPYLEKLGISHIYASPITKARTGSMHGYDVCDHSVVNPELGSTDEFYELIGAVKKRNMGWLQDIVPNHMAYSHENPYLLDVLENGQASDFADFFDITWDHQYESLRGRLLAPFLGKPYGQCVVDGELRVVFENGGLWAAYYDQRYPLSAESYWSVLGDEIVGTPSIPKDGDLAELADALNALAPGKEVSKAAKLRNIKQRLLTIGQRTSVITSYVQRRLEAFATGNNEGNARFDVLMNQQNFRLAFWKISAEELNYRRFFTVSDLICVRVEHAHVFDHIHHFVLGLVENGLIGGLRIDHIDGLFDPAGYLRRLRQRVPHAYIVVEKILDISETLPKAWPVQGTTGYDFLNHIHYPFCDTKAHKKFDRLYERFAGNHDDPGDLQMQKKRLIIGKHMAGDIDNLAHLVIRVAGTDLMGRDITLYGLRRALVEILTHFPVYRTYVTSSSFSADDAHYISRSLSRSREVLPGSSVEFDFIERFLMMRGDTVLQNDYDYAWKSAVMRFQQFTGPLMAKGFEDTLFYVYNRHVALNEVGGWPMRFGISIKELHTFIANRSKTHPHSMNASATHDTKRGEDTRARLQVITEMPAVWEKRMYVWRKLNSGYVTKCKGTVWPDKNDEYLLYQTLVGTFPFSGEISAEYSKRIKEYMIKAIKEAKVHTAWIKPDEQYENAVSGFVELCLDVTRSPIFIDSLRTFSRLISWYGMLNSLSEVVLKTTLPGVPDFYQGTELWDFSLVDPDNRRPVNYTERNKFIENPRPFEKLMSSAEDGYLKELLIQKCLKARKEFREVFQNGRYIPLTSRGSHKNNVMAFARITKKLTTLVIVPRFTSQLVRLGEYPQGRAIWTDTHIRLPKQLIGSTMHNILSGSKLPIGKEILVGDALDSFPLAVLIAPSPALDSVA